MDHFSRAARHTKRPDPEHQYIHLVRLAWDLRWLGVETRVELPLSGEPCVKALGAAKELRVIALVIGGKWIFQWGRGHTQKIDAFADDAAQILRKAAEQ